MSMLRRLATAAAIFVCLNAPAAPVPAMPMVRSASKPIITVEGLRFRDLDGDGRLTPFEDWRLPTAARVDDLVQRMTLAEKAGMLLIATNNPACDGGISDDGLRLIEVEQMTRFILRSKVVATPADCRVPLAPAAARMGYPQTPAAMATFTNAVQARREASRLGIPALFKDNARNHVETNPLFGIAQGAGVFSEFPKEAGLAAAALGAAAPPRRDGRMPERLVGDMGIIRQFAGVMAAEWQAIGLRGMYGYMADLGTEPRWSRFHETFSEDAGLVSDIMATLVAGLQGRVQPGGLALGPKTAVAMTLKHFPGGGPQQLGLDPHYSFGKNQLYTDPSGRFGFAWHLRPFEAAIRAGVGSIMPYYGVPIGVTVGGERIEEVGMAFSRQIVGDLLRGRLGFAGYVNSDSGIIEARGWGLEGNRINPATGKGFTVADRTAAAVKVGTDVLSEFRRAATITDLVAAGQLDERNHIDPAVRRLLAEQFALGLFENPYVDADAATRQIGTPRHRAIGMDVQRRSIVLLQNNGLLPMRRQQQVYVVGFNAVDLAARGYRVTDGNVATRPVVPQGTDVALIKLVIDNRGAEAWNSNDTATGGQGVDPGLGLVNPVTGQPQRSWGEQDPCVYDPRGEGASGCIDAGLRFGGSFPSEASLLSLSAMAGARSWRLTPSLATIQAVMREVGDPKRVVISIQFRNPYVLDEASGMRGAGALLANFGVSDAALLDVLTGRSAPRGRLPFALPATDSAVRNQHPDAPGYGETAGGTLFPLGFGLAYR